VIVKNSEKLTDLVINALITDEGWHKQWYLWEIARALGIDVKAELGTEYEASEGIAP